MARPNKNGLDYFPFDIDLFDDEKIVAISGEFGIKGEITVVKLLCAIYRNGYFILWNELLKFKLLKTLPGLSSELLEKIVSRLVRWDFFDKNLFNSMGVLTSIGIQTRYFEAAKRRKISTDLPYLLVNVDINGVNANINGVNVNINEQSKVKESKVKENPPLTPPENTQKCEEELNFKSIKSIIACGDRKFLDDDVYELLRMYDSPQREKHFVSDYLLSWRNDGCRCPYYEIIQQLQRLESSHQLHPRFKHNDFFAILNAKKSVTEGEFKQIKSIISSGKDENIIEKLKSAMIQIKSGKIKMPGRFILSQLKSK